MSATDEDLYYRDAPAGIPAAMTPMGAALEALEHVPAGPWLALTLDDIDTTSLSEWDLPAYLRAAAQMQAWSAARVAEGVAERASRSGGFGADKEVALALREPVGAAQRRRCRRPGAARRGRGRGVQLTRGEREDTGAVQWTSVLGQTRTVSPYDYRLASETRETGTATVATPADNDPPPF